MPLGLGPFLDQIVTLLVLLAAVIGGIHLYKNNVNRPQSPQVQAAQSVAPTKTDSSAQEILKQRYASGEINRTQYLDMLEALGAQSGARRISPSSQAEETVRERYARGEIDRQQFQQMMGDLKAPVP